MKGVLFDFWGTLMEHGTLPSPPRQIKKVLGLDIPFQDYIVRFEKAFMTQKYEDLGSAFTAVCKEFDLEPTKSRIDRLVGLWNKDNMLCKPFPETAGVLEDLKKDYKLGLISNTPSTIKMVLEKYDLEKYFDSMALSCEEGALKTDPKLFSKIIKDLGLKKEEVIMVGDSLESDVKGAEKAGIRAILVDRRDRRHHDDKVCTLEEVRALLEE